MYQEIENIQSFISDFFICGFTPDSIINSLLLKNPQKYKIDILFTYPHSAKKIEMLPYVKIIKVVFENSSFKIYLSKPESSKIDKIVLTDTNNFKYYVFWKIFYEELSEEFLMLEYEIKKPIKEKAPQVLSEISSTPLYTEKKALHNLHRFETMRKFIPNDIQLNKILLNDLIEKNNNFQIIKENNEKMKIKSSKKFYIPIAICIKTYIEDEDSIIDYLNILFNYFEEAILNYRNTSIKEELFLKLASSIFFSMFVIKPPIFSKFNIHIDNNMIELSENTNLDFPFQNDVSLAYLFKQFEAIHILKLWSAALIEEPILIYSDKNESLFNFVKSLSQLIFPLSFERYSIGEISNVEYFDSGFSCLFWQISSLKFQKEQVLELLKKTNKAWYFIDIEGNKNDLIILNQEKQYPFLNELEDKLEKLLFQNSQLIMDKTKSSLRIFSIKIREFFFNQIKRIIDYPVESTIKFVNKSNKFPSIELLKNKWLKPFKSQSYEKEYFEKVYESACFIRFYEEFCNYNKVSTDGSSERHYSSNYLRYRAISNLKGLNKIDMKGITNFEVNFKFTIQNFASIMRKLYPKIDTLTDNNWVQFILQSHNHTQYIPQSSIKKNTENNQLNVLLNSKRLANLQNKNENKDTRSNSRHLIRKPIANQNRKSEFSKKMNLNCLQFSPRNESQKETDRAISIFYGLHGMLTFLNSILNTKNYKTSSSYMLEYIILIISKLKELKSSESNQFYRQLFSNTGEKVEFNQNINQFIDYRNFQAQANTKYKETSDSKINDNSNNENDDSFSLVGKSKSDIYDKMEQLSINQNIKENNLALALIDINDNYFHKLREEGNNFIKFSSLISYQYILFEAYYRYKYNKLYTLEFIVENLLDAYVILYLNFHKYYEIFFPLNFFLIVLKQLKLEYFNELVRIPGPINSEIVSIEQTKKLQEKEMLSNEYIKAASPEAKYSIKENQDLEIRFKNSFLKIVKCLRSMKRRKRCFVNNFELKVDFVNLDPNKAIEILIQSLITILLSEKTKSISIFEKASKKLEFEEVKKYCYLIKNPNFFIKNSESSSKCEIYLDNPAKTVSFFLNLRNFILLFTLCSIKTNKIPKNVEEWDYFYKRECIKIGNQLINIDVIENLIFNLKSIQYSEMQKNESTNFFTIDANNVKWDTFFYIGYYNISIDSPPLKIWKAENLFEKLKESAIDYISKKVLFNPNNKEIKLPNIFEPIYYEISDKERIKLLQFIGLNCKLNLNEVDYQNEFFWKDFKVTFSSYNWNFKLEL